MHQPTVQGNHGLVDQGELAAVQRSDQVGLQREPVGDPAAERLVLDLAPTAAELLRAVRGDVCLPQQVAEAS